MRAIFVIVSPMVCAAGLLWSPVAQADWSELGKEDDASYYFDKASVMPIHVARLAWTLADLPSASQTASGESYQSMMARWRMDCQTDTVVQLAVSYFDKPMGKGREVAKEDFHAWPSREMAIRPGTYLATLKKEVCRARFANPLGTLD